MDFPKNMDECVYFTNRKLSDGTRIIAFARKTPCTKCKKGLMGKPREKGKVKMRSQEYVCPECGHSVPKEDYEDSLELEIEYTDSAGKERKEARVPFKRKSWQGMKAFVFVNEFTGEKQGITKRLKEKGDPDD